MRITQLTPGTGHFYCGNCLRDSALARALIDQGHDVTMVPLYLPVFAETDPPTIPPRVFLGGINIYLQHKLPLLGRLPKFIRRGFDAPRLLRWSAKRGDMTDAAKHADLAIATLRGDDDSNARELKQLIDWLREHERPDVICLCNSLLVGLAKPLKAALGVPIIATLHGEDGFLDALPPAKGETAWSIMRERSGDVDAFIAVSDFYGQQMSKRLDIDPQRLHVVHNGIRLDDIPTADSGSDNHRPTSDARSTIGYLARMCADKGLHTLIDAFIELRRRKTIVDPQLSVVGVQLKADRRFVRELESRLDKAGCRDAVTFAANVSREDKLTFLRSINVLSVPATYGEAFGLYLIEAMAHGVPVVQPRHGAFPEIIERSGGGLLCEPDDPISLADGLEHLLLDRSMSAELGAAGRRSVQEHFNADRMARDVAEVCTLVRQNKVDATVSTDAVANQPQHSNA